MDENTIFIKTADGEEAVKHRTRLVQRNLRNILIMVDGQSSVADLAERFGDLAVVENVVSELSALGFIVAAHHEPASPSMDTTEVADEEAPVDAGAAEPTSSSLEAAPTADISVAQPPSKAVVAQPQPLIEEIFFDAPEYFSDPAPARPAATPVPGRRDVEPSRSGSPLIAALKEVWPQESRRSRRDLLEAQYQGPSPVRIKPVRRAAKRFYISWPLMAVMIVGGVVSVLALVALLFPYDRYLPDIEKRASEALHDPVKIGKINFAFLPRPNLTLRGVVVGKERFLSADTVRVLPGFFSLLTDKKVFHELQVDHVIVKYQGLNRVPQWSSGSNVEVQRIRVSNLSLDLGDVVLDGMGGEMTMHANGMLEKIDLRNSADTFQLNLVPKGQTFTFEAIANLWKLPTAPGVTFDYLQAQGELGATRLALNKLEGKLYGGLLSGNAVLDWSRGATIGGDLELQRIDLTKLLAALNPDLEAEGDLSGNARFDSKTERLARLGESLRVDGNVDIVRGAIKRFDLIEAVRKGRGEPMRGGFTRFEQLTAKLSQDQQAWKLSNLRISSGVMKAGGSVSLDKDAQLAGAIDVELKSSATLVRAQLGVTGPLKEPLLTTTRGGRK